MRIHFFIRALNRDGAGSHQNAIAYVRYLQECGHTVVVHTINSSGNPPEDIEVVAHAREKLGFVAGNTFLTKTLFEYEKDADVFFLYGVDFPWGAGRYRKMGGIKPVVVYLDTCTSTMKGGQRLSFVYYLKRLLWEKIFGLRDAAWVDRYIASSPFIQKMFVQNGFPESKFAIVPNFFEFKTPQTDKEASATVRLLYAGRLTHDKGVDLLIEAVKDIPSDARWYLRIVGSGPLEAECKGMAAAYKLENRVEFVPWVTKDELQKIYEATDILVHPSRIPEAFGRTFVEAMAHGIPVIASNIGAAPWTIGDGGIFFKNENVPELREAILRLLKDEVLRERLGREGLKQSQKFAKSIVAPQLEAAIQTVAKV